MLSDLQFKALQNLTQDKSVIASRSDKSYSVVVMNNSSYLSKMYDILSDSNKFQSCKIDNNILYLAKFQRFLRSLEADGILDNNDYKQLHPSSTRIPAMYGLPKVREPSVPLRPILSAIGFSIMKQPDGLQANSLFFGIIQLILKAFSNLLTISKINKCFQNKIMVPFYEKSLFSNFPVSFTIKLIIDAI